MNRNLQKNELFHEIEYYDVSKIIEKAIVLKAVKYHNKYSIPKNLKLSLISSLPYSKLYFQREI